MPVEYLSPFSCYDFCGNQKPFFNIWFYLSFPPHTSLTLVVGATQCIYIMGGTNILNLTLLNTGFYKRTIKGKPYFSLCKMQQVWPAMQMSPPASQCVFLLIFFVSLDTSWLTPMPRIKRFFALSFWRHKIREVAPIIRVHIPRSAVVTNIYAHISTLQLQSWLLLP